MAIPVVSDFSPKTKTDGITAIDAVVIVIDDTYNEGIDSFPNASVDAPGTATLCTSQYFDSEDPTQYETIEYTERDVVAMELKGVTRAVAGTAQAWASGSFIASYVPGYAYNELSAHTREGDTDDVHGYTTYINNLPTHGFKNKIINGDFRIWQRGTSIAAGVGGYIADRWNNVAATATIAPARQTFTVGQTDVPGEPQYFHRSVVVAGNNAASVARTFQRIEDVRSFAGQTVTVSFYAKADAAKDMSIEFLQNFGSGGSPSADVSAIGAEKLSLTTSWQKFTATIAIPSISGKTIGTTANTSYLEFNFWFDSGATNATRASSIGYQSGTFDIALVQIKAGSVATPFEQRPIGLELSLCQRYFTQTGINERWRITYLDANSLSIRFPFLVPTRIAPTSNVYTSASLSVRGLAGDEKTGFSFTASAASNTVGGIAATKSTHGLDDNIIIQTGATAGAVWYDAEL